MSLYQKPGRYSTEFGLVKAYGIAAAAVLASGVAASSFDWPGKVAGLVLVISAPVLALDLALLSATTASNQVWSNISASQVGSYGANVPQMSFATTYTNGTATGTVSYGFTAGTQTLSGAALLWGTTNTLSTNAATAGIAMYNHGLFAASQQIQANNTISVSATFAINTSN